MKCEHGVYIPAGETRALYCTYCTPGGPHDTHDVVISRHSDQPLSLEGRLMANKHANYACPNCGSTIYMRKHEKNALLRICAECDHEYKAPRAKGGSDASE